MNTISDIFLCTENNSVSVINLRHPDLHRVTKDIINLFNGLGDGAFDPNLIGITRQLKKLRFELSAAPLSKEYFSGKIDELILSLSEKEYYFGFVFPHSQIHLQTLLQDLIVFRESNLNLLQEEIIRLLLKEPNTHFPILLKEKRHISIADAEFRNLLSGNNYSFTSQDGLRGNTSFVKMVVIGPFSWYDDFVFSAPRAKEIFVYKYSFLRGSWKYSQPFISPVRYKRSQKQQIVDESEVDGIDADFILPTTSIDSLYQKALDEIKNSSFEEEYSEAYLFILEGDNVVFLEVEGSRLLIIDMDDNADFDELSRIGAREIEKGMFILLRTEGGGDYIKPIADKILGSQAEELREAQKKWKDELRTEVKKHGFYRSLKILLENGCEIASPMNLRNWLNENNISTREFKHFEAIFRFINRESEAKSYWEKMRIIRNAHGQAGHRIRQMLLEKVRKSDLNYLINNGIMEFTLEEEQSGSLTAFRVVNYVKDKKFTVAPWRIGSPMKFDEGSWQ